MKTNYLLSTLAPAIILFAVQAVANAGVVKDHPGHWLGEMKLADGRVLKSGVELFSRADGSAWASFSSPDQGAFNMVVNGIDEKGDSAELQLGFASMTLRWAGDHFKAEWKQDGESFHHDLKKVEGFGMKARAQDPVAPFPYVDEELSIPAADGVTLAATLSVPNHAIKPNLVILVHGSGPLTRDSEGAGHRMFAVLADHLARQGVAVLRYDKRGVARSSGSFENHTQADLVDDLAAIVRTIRTRPGFGRLGLIGHSEGPSIAAKVAARHPESVDFLVSMAGVGLKGLDLMLLQDRLLAKDNGASPAEIARLMAYVRRYYEIVIAQADKDARIAGLKALQAGLPQSERDLINKFKMNVGTLALDVVAQPFVRVLLMADPDAAWRAVRCPVLALNGSLDLQVPPESMAGIVASLRKGGNRKIESTVIPSLNHLFQTAKTGSEREYEVIEETIAPVALKQIAAFARKQ